MPPQELSRAEPFVIEKTHLQQASDTVMRASSWLITTTEEMVLLGREAGKSVFAHAENKITEMPPFMVLPIDLRNVRFFDVSFADELIVRLCQRISSGEIKDRYFMLTQVHAELQENLHVYLQNREQACVCEGTDSKISIRGAISQELRETYELALLAKSITARELIVALDAKKLSPTLSINASSNRLARLNKMGLLAFQKSENVAEGGRQNVYLPVR